MLYSFLLSLTYKKEKKIDESSLFQSFVSWFLGFFVCLHSDVVTLHHLRVGIVLRCIHGCVHLWAFSDKITWLSPFLVAFVCLLTPILSLPFLFFSFIFRSMNLTQYFAFFYGLSTQMCAISKQKMALQMAYLFT